MTNIVTFANGVMKFGEVSPNPGGVVTQSQLETMGASIAPVEVVEASPVPEVVLSSVEDTPANPKKTAEELKSMKVDELKAYAAMLNVDLHGITLKDDIIEAILKAE